MQSSSTDSHVPRRGWQLKAAATLAMAAPPLVVFIFPTLSLIARNSDYFTSGYRAGWPLYLASLVSLLGGAGVLTLGRGTFGRFMGALYLTSAGAWFLHALAVRIIESAFVTAAAAALWLFAAAYASRSPRPALVQYSGVIAGALVFGSGMPVLVVAQEPTSAPGDAHIGYQDDGYIAEDLPNIYHLVFDEYQADFFQLLLDDDLRRDLRGFTLYSDATTTYGRTEMSFASMFASQDYSYDISPEEQLVRAFHEPDSTLQILGDLGYRRTGYLHRSKYVGGNNPPFDEWMLHDQLAGSGHLTSQTKLLMSLWIYAQTPEALSRHLLPEHHYDQLTADAFLPEDAPPRSVISLQHLIGREASLPSHGRYTFAHLLVPHFPYVLQPDCTYAPGEVTGPVEQAACANTLIREFVATLRDLGRLEQSIVIIQADHGSWYELINGTLREQRDDGLFSEEASSARARILLLVHFPSRASDAADELQVVQRPTLVEDIMPTVFDELGLEYDFSGNRLSLHETPAPDRVRYYHFYRKGDDERVAAGPMVRFIVQAGRATYEREIMIPDPPRQSR